MNDLITVLDDLSLVIEKKNDIKILEIGTGTGQNSTKILFNYFLNKYKDFEIISYEGDNALYDVANKVWKYTSNVKIVNEYFSDKEDIINLLIPNLPEYIIDYNETNERFTKKYQKIYDNYHNPFTTLDYIPDYIFIDCSRFMHLTIINFCYNMFKSNPNCIYIIEDDYFVNGNYGELEIIEKYFKLDIIKKYKKGSWQWPFVTFKIVEKN